MSLSDRIADCAVFHPENYRPFVVAGRAYGRVTHDFATRLAAFPDVFAVTDDMAAVRNDLTTPAARTDGVEAALQALKDQGCIPGWRGEHYPVSAHFYADPVMTIERAAVALIGTKGYGVHLNGYVEKPDGLHMWVGKRSMKKPTGPGKLDQMVGGGQPIGISVHDNLMKECAEEAGMDKDLAATAKPVGTISYLTERPDGLRHDVLFNFDIALPEDYVPTPTDGEVDAFYLWPVTEILDRLRAGDDFKFNAALVILDFAVRHGILGPSDPEYIAVTEGLRLGRAGALAVG